MKKMILILVVLALGFFPGVLLQGNLNITKVGEWGTGYYKDIFVQDNYAYCAAGRGGLDIIDISDPCNPWKIGNYETMHNVKRVSVKGNYAYVTDFKGGLKVLDVSNPSSSVLVGSYDQLCAHGLYVEGNFAYVTDLNEGLFIIDISEPSSPGLVGTYPITDEPGTIVINHNLYVSGNYLYMAVSRLLFYGNYAGELLILDISIPASPVLVGKYDNLLQPRGVHVKEQYAYIADERSGFQVVDISDKSHPIMAGNWQEPFGTSTMDVYVVENYAYVGNSAAGVMVFDISSRSNPVLLGSVSRNAIPYRVRVRGNYAYTAYNSKGMQVIDIQDPSSLTVVGQYDTSVVLDNVVTRNNKIYFGECYEGLIIGDISSSSSISIVGSYDIDKSWGFEAAISGHYAYIYGSFNGMLSVIDISNPSSPVLVGKTGFVESVMDIHLQGDYVYASVGYAGFYVVDISTPSSPTPIGHCDLYGFAESVFVSNSYAYVCDGNLKVIDISDPSSPIQVAGWISPDDVNDVYVYGKYAYTAGRSGLTVIDVSDPTAPFKVGEGETPRAVRRIFVKDYYAYLYGNYGGGLWIFDLSSPISPSQKGNYEDQPLIRNIFVDDSHIYAIGDKANLLILDFDKSFTSPRIRLNRAEINFASVVNGSAPGPQSFMVGNSGGGTLNWIAAADQNWLFISPFSGTGSGEITVSVDPSNLVPGTYKGTIFVSSADAPNSPQTVGVYMTIYTGVQTSGPFGEFATPVEGALTSGSIPVTGWALDDIGVQCVEIFREEGKSLIYIGDAVFVDGARPDVEQAYPTYPNNYKAGWGYMMLTNFLPGGGNGTFKIHAIAADLEGNQVTLGTKTIICDNDNAVKPFGAIDTPNQGGIASGSNYVNYGWVLTPLPNSIPTDGSTIRVWVDGVAVGNPVYSQYRADIAGLFPGYNNSNGAVGYFYLDTTQYENGVHTIQWTAVDDAGNTDGIGSRYFTIQNAAGSRSHSAWQAEGRERNKACLFRDPIRDIPVDYSNPIWVRRGYNQRIKPKVLYPDEEGMITIEMKELERLKIRFFEPGHKNSTLRVNQLPIGSTLDSERGVFYWSPGPGFIGEYRFVFISGDQQGHKTRRDVRVIIRPKY